jgi:hypothetical protein
LNLSVSDFVGYRNHAVTTINVVEIGFAIVALWDECLDVSPMFWATTLWRETLVCLEEQAFEPVFSPIIHPIRFLEESQVLFQVWHQTCSIEL